MASRTVYDDLADRIRGLVREEAVQVAPAIERGSVVTASPLVIDLGDDVLIEEGDPDVEFDRALLTDRPEPGAVVRVHMADGDYIVGGVLEGGEDG